MNIINARTAAEIAARVNAERREIARAHAEFCLREMIMPCIAESAEEGKTAVYITTPTSGDLYEYKYLIGTMLRDLGYGVDFKNGKDFSIKW